MNSYSLCRWLCCATCVVGAWAPAITPIEVQRSLDKGASITFVDVRSLTAYKEGHIPNAISIPASLVSRKELPPLGTVVVYDDGLGTDTASAAVTALNQKAGISAQVLDGGLAAWESSHSVTTHSRGLSPEALPLITYDKLKRTQSNNVVLVDLRGGATAKTSVKALAATTTSDLAAEFPGARVTKSPFQIPAAKVLAVGPTTPPLLVLIDDGDGSAQQMARTLKANGVKRFVILAGGDEMIQRQGQSGSDRIGSTVTVQKAGAVGAMNSTK